LCSCLRLVHGVVDISFQFRKLPRRGLCARTNHDVVPTGNLDPAKRLPQPALDSIPMSRSTASLHYETKSRLILPGSPRCVYRYPSALGGSPLRQQPNQVSRPPQRLWLPHGVRRLGREPGAALGPPMLDDPPTAARLHAGPKPVLALAPPNVRLEGPLAHASSPFRLPRESLRVVTVRENLPGSIECGRSIAQRLFPLISQFFGF
jgi:hypothetical protein